MSNTSTLFILIFHWITKLNFSSFHFSPQLVSFGNMSEITPKGMSFLRVGAITEDLENPGGLIIGNKLSIAQMAPNGTTRTITGQ